MSNEKTVTVVNETYPETAGTDYERTAIEIPIYYKGEYAETIEGYAYLKIEREAPFTNRFGRRQVDFKVVQWEIHGYSKTLQKDIFMTLTDSPQPTSYTFSNQVGSDFPATILYNGIYDVYIGSEKICTGLSGVGLAHEIYSIPPNATASFQKVFQYGDITARAGACACAVETNIDPVAWAKEVSQVIALRNGN